MKEFEGLKVPYEPQRSWEWMEDKENKCPHCCHRKDGCIDCIYSYLNSEKRKLFYELNFKYEMPVLTDGTFVSTKQGKYWYILNNLFQPIELKFESTDGLTTRRSVEIGEGVLSRTGFNYKDIDKVWLPDKFSAGGLVYRLNKILTEKVEPSWIRPEEVKEVTMAEVEKQFGCKVKIKKEE